MALIEKLAAIADAIRSKTGKTEGLTLEQMPGEIEGIETGGGVSEQEILRGISDGTYPSGSVVIPGTPERASFVGTNITEVTFPDATVLVANLCESWNKLVKLSAPKAETLRGSYSIGKCNSLEIIDLPSVKTFEVNSLHSCRAAKVVNAPLLENLGIGCFQNFNSLPMFDANKITQIPSYAFGACFVLSVLILRSYNVVALSNATDCFSRTPFQGYNGLTGTVYVPSALIEQYQQATNWSTLYAAGTCIFKPLEDYTIDGTTTGEMDWAKIEGETA